MAHSSSTAQDTRDTQERVESQDVILDGLVCPPQSGARQIHHRPAAASNIVRVGRYEFADCIAKGGMATVHFARLHGDFGFCRVVAVKRLLPQFATDEQFKAMFIEEARLAARIRHPNVVSTLDVVADGNEVLLVMDYVHGDALSSLCRHLRRLQTPIAPMAVTSAILSDVLRGLAFAHSTTDKNGEPLNIVHCDVSPQNILVGVDGVARVLDFGIAKAADSLSDASQGVVRGKPGYMAPEQLNGTAATPRSDLFAVGVVLWEMLTGQRLFGGAGFRASLAQRHHSQIDPPRARNPAVNPALEAVVMKALERDPASRYRDASEMMRALELACPPARPSAVAEWVEELAADTLVERGFMLSRLESEKRRSIPVPSGADEALMLSADDLLTDGISTARSLQTSERYTPPRNGRKLATVIGLMSVTFGLGGFLAWQSGTAVNLPEAATSAPSTNSATVNLPPSAATATTKHSPSTADTATNDVITTSPKVAPASPLVGTKPPVNRPRLDKCSPPYTIDAAGRKHYRAECFK